MNGTTKNQFTLAHLAGLAVLFVFICWMADMAGCNPDTALNSEHESGPKLISKAQWMQKVRPYWNPGGSIKMTTVANFKALMGEPSQTQTDGDTGHAYWSYQCSDGTVEVDLVDPNMTGGTMAISSISDY